MTFFGSVHFVEASRAVVEKVADTPEFRRAAKFAPFAFEGGHFRTFGQVLVKVFEAFVVVVTTIACSQMSDFMELPLNLILESFSTVPTPVFSLNPRLSFEARRRNAAVGCTILQAGIVRI